MFLLTAPILQYAVITDPFPLLASAETGNLNKARLTALATNSTGGDVVLQGIIIQVPIGAGADKLTLDAAVIGPVAPANWTLSSTQTPPGLTIYVFVPLSGQATLGKGQSLSFVFNNIEVNRTPGTFAIQITEGTGNCQPPDCPTYTEHLTKFPNGWGQVAFWVSPANIPYQGSTTLNWAGPQGAAYTIEYLAQGQVVLIPKLGDPPLANQGQYPGVRNPPLTLEATTVFTLNVSQRIDNEQFHAQQQATVSVGPPPPPTPRITKFNGSVAIEESQVRFTLSWITESAERVTITQVPGLQQECDTITLQFSSFNPLQGSYILEARTGSNSVTSTINIVWVASNSAPAGSSPKDCAILPNGNRLFVTNTVSNNISVLDPLTLGNVSGSPFSLSGAYRTAASPNSTRVYVTTNTHPSYKLNGFNSSDLRSVPGSPAASHSSGRPAVTPDNNRIYVPGGSEVWVFNAIDMKKVGSITVGFDPQAIAFTPDGSRAFVANGANGVSVIDSNTLQRIRTVMLGVFNLDAAVTPDGKQLYIADAGGTSIYVLDAITLEQLPGSPLGLGVSPLRVQPSRNSKLIFALCDSLNPRLFVIDTQTRKVLGSAPAASSPEGLAVSPDNIRVYVAAGNGNRIWTFLPSAAGGTG